MIKKINDPIYFKVPVHDMGESERDDDYRQDFSGPVKVEKSYLVEKIEEISKTSGRY